MIRTFYHTLKWGKTTLPRLIMALVFTYQGGGGARALEADGKRS